MPQLDGLRGAAACAVMFAHFHGGALVERLPLGTAPLRLFFVLSGFLITGMLIEGTMSRAFIGAFYARRALRLLPLYFAAIAAALAAWPSARELWPYYLLHSINVCAPIRGELCAPAHFWSLSAEEHFYALWPLVVLALDRRRLIQICVALVVAAPVYRLVMLELTGERYASQVLVFGVMDSLAIGALLAVGARSEWRMPRWVLPAGLIGFAIYVALYAGARRSAFEIGWGDTALLPLLAWLIYGAAAGFRGALGRVLDWKPLRELGRISYGVYIIHYFVLSAAMLTPGLQGYPKVLVLSFLTIVLAAISWHFFEQPFNALKDRFPLRGPADARLDSARAYGRVDRA